MKNLTFYRITRKYNLRYRSTKTKTYFSKTQLLNQILPSLEAVFTFGKLYRIPPCKGRIVNLDESQHYLAPHVQRTYYQSAVKNIY